MAQGPTKEKLSQLAKMLEGDLQSDDLTRLLYATDASSYREIPRAIAFPKTVRDMQILVQFATENGTTLIPRTAGTSLAGQVVGKGLIVDVTRYFNNILEYNAEEGWVRVQPGVVRDDLNRYLKPYGVFFGPETSTANRAMIGGMIGNNSCGANSVVYGSTREYLQQATVVISDGTEVSFGELTKEEFDEKCSLVSLEGDIYRHARNLLGDEKVRDRIKRNYPDPSIPRRNTGYALDKLMDCEPFTGSANKFNFCKLLAGSEGTLGLVAEAKLKVSPLPPARQALVCVHFKNLQDSLVAAQIALNHSPFAVELMDDYILNATRNNLKYSHYMFFVEGEPKAILVVELKGEDDGELEKRANRLIKELKEQELGYHYPIVWNEQAKLVWELRKAGLGLLSNMPGDPKPVPVIEDTAVGMQDLPRYIAEFNEILKQKGLSSVHYAHAGSGELHLRPILDLKTIDGNLMFREIATDISKLVKRYNGSLSGEHGDGRLRGEFIPYMIGEENYQDLVALKKVWDPQNVFNKGKITGTPSMNTNLRYEPGHDTPEYETMLDFSATLGIVRAAEQCNGSGDCRKSIGAGGVMCPSFMATHEEKNATRARANIFREIAGRETSNKNPFLSEEIKDVFDQCLSCKGCKSECPSNVDIGKIKTEFLYQNQKLTGVPFRTKMIGNFAKSNKMLERTPWLYNMVATVEPLSTLFKSAVGFAPKRSLPKMNKQTVVNWFNRNKTDHFGLPKPTKNTRVLVFVDEFTNYNDFTAGAAVIKSLTRLGYPVALTDTFQSGRSYLSKGMLDEAKVIANENVEAVFAQLQDDAVVVGIEPSALLSFRDEYLELVDDREKAKAIADKALLYEEFIMKEVENGQIDTSLFQPIGKTLKFHGHCHQKALADVSALGHVLALIPDANPEQIPSGCCGMAGSFGYEKEHYDLSMKVGELVLFPAVRDKTDHELIVAPGTSCRHQIKDGTKTESWHPAEMLWLSLNGA